MGLCIFVFVGGIAELEAIWAFGDAALGIMTFPNLISIILLTGALKGMTKDYFAESHVPINKDDLLNVAIEAALAASNLVMEASDRPRVANHKGITDLVTETDLKSEKTIKAIIRSFYKDHTILAEETGQDTNISDYLWIIDPLDGLRFCTWIPFVCHIYRIIL